MENPILSWKTRKKDYHSDGWDTFSDFKRSAEIDYFVFRLMYLQNFHFKLADVLIKKAGECIEKLLKLFYYTANVFKVDQVNFKKLGHNLHKIRIENGKIDDYFNSYSDLVTFCNEYSKKSPDNIDGHQLFGYSEIGAIQSLKYDLNKVLNLLDKLFADTMFALRSTNITLDYFYFYSGHPSGLSYISTFDKDENDRIIEIYFKDNVYINEIYNRNIEYFNNKFITSIINNKVYKAPSKPIFPISDREEWIEDERWIVVGNKVYPK